MTKPNDPVNGQFHGLTKREYFAAMAMQGLLACEKSETFAAECGVFTADELIKELNKTSNDKTDD